MAGSMAPHLILIRKIQHLTDARYFAAMGVDWMSMELTEDQMSFDRWHALKDWVAGVKLVAEFDFKNEDLLAKVIIDAMPEGVVLDETSTLFISEDIQVFREIQDSSKVTDQRNDYFISPIDGMLRLNNFPIDIEEIFLQADWNMEKLKEVISTGYKGGFCFEGTKEEMTGMKDYSEMDEMLERLKD